MQDVGNDNYVFINREMLHLQHFYNKSWMISYYWFKFEFSIKISFLT